MKKRDFSVRNTDIAIIGMAGRFPASDNIEQFMEKLCNGEECLTKQFNKNSGAKVYSFGKMNDIYGFDADFFGIQGSTAAMMDPQQRHFMEVAYNALDDAGYAASANRRIGVFAGSEEPMYVWQLYMSGGFNDWKDMLKYRNAEESGMTRLFLNGTMASKLAYEMDFHGPCIYMKAACATTLYTTHLAVQSLLNYECDLAVSGASNIVCEQEYYESVQNVCSRQGQVRAFDKAGDGFVPGSGTGAVILKRLDEAVKAHDHIYAVIRGSGVGNDGNRKIGFSAPSVQGEQDVISDAVYVAEVEPEDITYIETHGTATPLGDSVEITALKNIFENGRSRNMKCCIGAVKSNVGHLNSSAGIAGIIKTAQMIENGIMPPQINCTDINDELASSDVFEINTKKREWNCKDDLRIAGVSAFGIGGINAHIIMSEYPDKNSESDDTGNTYIVPISAKSEEALNRNVKAFRSFMNTDCKKSARDIAYTYRRKKEYEYRSAEIIGSDGKNYTGYQFVHNCSLFRQGMKNVFMYNGAGGSYPEMGLQLYKSSDIYRNAVKKCLDELSELFPQTDWMDKIYHPGDNVSYNMLAVFVFEYAMTELVMEIGVMPDYLIGFSLGEYSAACISGVFSLRDAMRLIVRRAELLADTEEGEMISVSVTPDEIKKLSSDNISVAAVNGYDRVIVSGRKADIAELRETLKREKKLFMNLSVKTAGHSHLVRDAAREFAKEFDDIKFGEMRIPIISTVTGKPVSADEICTVDYWERHMYDTVLFYNAASYAANESPCCFIEMGAGRQLTMTVGRNIPDVGSRHFALSSVYSESVPETAQVQFLAAELWSMGADISWNIISNTDGGYTVRVPEYQFVHKEYKKDISHYREILALGNQAYETHCFLNSCGKTDDTVISHDVSEIQATAGESDESKLIKMICSIIGKTDVGLDEDLFSAGMDSLSAIALNTKIKNEFGKGLVMTDLYDCQTARDILGKIRSRCDGNDSDVAHIKREKGTLDDILASL